MRYTVRAQFLVHSAGHEFRQVVAVKGVRMEPPARIELATCALRMRCSTAELGWLEISGRSSPFLLSRLESLDKLARFGGTSMLTAVF